MIVCLDTNVVIYLVEKKPVWGPKAEARLTALQTAGDEVALCDATRLECLLKPLATGDTGAEAAYRALFAAAWVRMLPVSIATWEGPPASGRRTISRFWTASIWRPPSSMAAGCS
jgi:predicted nucleic acid-binding protein